MKYIGVDLGSSFIKAVLMDLDQGKIVDQDKMATPEKEPYKNPNYFEIPAKKIVEIVKQLPHKCTDLYMRFRKKKICIYPGRICGV